MRKIYIDQSEIKKLISKFVLIENFDGGWSSKYMDPDSKEIWLKYQVNSEYHGGGINNLIKLPEPTTTELIKIAFNSDYIDEVIGAALRLRDNEQYLSIDFRNEMITDIEKMNILILSQKEKVRLKAAIQYSELDHGENRREVLGKQITEIQSDTNYFMQIAHRAFLILEQIGETS